jgi:hypothetical protein
MGWAAIVSQVAAPGQPAIALPTEVTSARREEAGTYDAVVRLIGNV